GTHTITYNVGTGTCSDTDQIDITVNLTPNATITNPGGFCNTDDAINLSALPIGGTWSGVGIIDNTTGTFDPQAAGQGSFLISYTVSENGCDGIDQVTINVDAAPDVTIKPIGPICYDNIIIELEAETEGGMWSGPGVSTSGNFNVAQAGVGVHEIVYEFGGNCGGIGTLEVEIFPSDINTNYVVYNPLCLSGNDGVIELITTGGTAPYTYEWGENSYSETGNITGLTGGEYSITVIDSNGCFVEIDEIIIEDGKNDCIFIPNAFTPNEDGINDEWVITNIEAFSDYMVKVFNRWGQEVYVGYAGSQPWDGFYNGKPLPAGSYIYIVEIKDIEKEFVGVVTLIR
ncbi:MAG: gliding motility-associated C-terminal domain-containing protein, partial [Bacteroidales bacterium]|nr:gliding motility-associated C-terminal domain-containing protein [Bacteroidales bacterium]